MMERTTRQGQLGRVQKRLRHWRSQHGGRGRKLPEELWAAAVDVAVVEGLDVTARALEVDRDRLRERVARWGGGGAAFAELPAGLSPAFVEVDAQRVFTRGQMVVRLSGRDGKQLEITLEGGAAEVASLVQTFWEGSR